LEPQWWHTLDVIQHLYYTPKVSLNHHFSHALLASIEVLIDHCGGPWLCELIFVVADKTLISINTLLYAADLL